VFAGATEALLVFRPFLSHRICNFNQVTGVIHSRCCRLAWCAGILLALVATAAHAQRVRFEGTDGGSEFAPNTSLPDGTAWVARGSSTASSSSNSASFGSPAAYNAPIYTASTTPLPSTSVYTASAAPLTSAPLSSTPIYTASAAPLTTTTIYTASTAPLTTSTPMPSPAAAYGSSIGPPPISTASPTSPWDPYHVAQRPAAFSGTITSASGQFLVPQPMPRVPYYTQQPVAQTGQPYVILPETPPAQPGAVVYPGPVPPAMVSTPAVATLGPALPPPYPPPVYATSCYAIVDAIYFTRNVSAGNQALVLRDVVNVTDPNVVFSTADLSFPFQVGPRITLGHEFDPTFAFEGSYFGIFNWKKTLTATGANDLNLPGDLALDGGLAFIGADQVTITYRSQVNNGELNLLRHYGDLSCLIGFRYFELGESLNIDAVDNVDGTGFYDVNAYNNLFGLQGGLRLQHACGKWSYDLTGKAGVYGNWASSSQSIEDAGTALRNVRTTSTAVAFLGELGFNLNYQFSQNWFLLGGYQVYWVDGVALAPNQLDFTNTASSGTTLDKKGSLFMQGTNAGLMARW
jgi:hypothetical protein